MAEENGVARLEELFAQAGTISVPNEARSVGCIGVIAGRTRGRHGVKKGRFITPQHTWAKKNRLSAKQQRKNKSRAE